MCIFAAEIKTNEKNDETNLILSGIYVLCPVYAGCRELSVPK